MAGMHINKAGAIGLAAAAALTLGACTSATEAEPQTSVSQAQPSAAAISEVVSPQEFNEVIQQPDVVTLDVRTPAEFAEGHIEGAQNIDINGPDFAGEVAKLDPNTTYAVYCRSGKRAGMAEADLVAAGFTNVRDLDGHMLQWEADGYPIE